MNDTSRPTGTRPFIEAIAKHLPPSPSVLRLIDIGGEVWTVLAETRADLDVTSVAADTDSWPVLREPVDAVVALNPALTDALLDNAWVALRPGGRLVIVDTERTPSDTLVSLLQDNGFTRLLVEPAIPDGGVLMRGEKPHSTTDTMERIRQVAAIDDTLVDFSGYEGKYVHLLIRQTPNKPVWKLDAGEPLEWDAAAVTRDGSPVLLAFTGLPRAVGFMQRAVLANRIQGINKVARFRRAVAQTWAHPSVVNPTTAILDGREVVFVPVDPQSAEAPEE